MVKDESIKVEAAAELTVWDKLRKAFPPESVGKLPKGGRSVDFVGHAAVTDRLNNAAGPENWDYEFMSTDDYGLPRTDSKGNLWIVLKVRDGKDGDWVKRPGYGDGSTSMKELIGDALRNAAMRFGVALDLWSKEELESAIEDPTNKTERATTPPPAKAPAKAPEAAPAPASASAAAPRKLIAQAQILMLMGRLRDATGTTDRDQLVELFEFNFDKKPNMVTQDEFSTILEAIAAIAEPAESV